MESRSCCILPMNSGATCRDDAIFLISLTVFAPSVVAIVACIVSFTFHNRRRYLLVLFSCCTVFVCCSFLQVEITRMFSTLDLGLTPMSSMLWVGITRLVLSPVRFSSVDIFLHLSYRPQAVSSTNRFSCICGRTISIFLCT